MSNHIRAKVSKERRAKNFEAEAETLELDRIAYLRSLNVDVCTCQCQVGGACSRPVCTGAAMMQMEAAL